MLESSVTTLENCITGRELESCMSAHKIQFQINSTVNPSTKALANKWILRIKKTKNAKEGEKLRFMKFLKVKGHCDGIEV